MQLVGDCLTHGCGSSPLTARNLVVDDQIYRSEQDRLSH
jgi:hypothetical protein